MSSRRGGGGGGEGAGHFESGVGHLNYLAVPGVGIFQFFVHMTTNHFPGWGISIIFDLTFLPGAGEFYSIFLENVPPYSHPMPCLPPSPFPLPPVSPA